MAKFRFINSSRWICMCHVENCVCKKCQYLSLSGLITWEVFVALKCPKGENVKLIFKYFNNMQNSLNFNNNNWWSWYYWGNSLKSKIRIIFNVAGDETSRAASPRRLQSTRSKSLININNSLNIHTERWRERESKRYQGEISTRLSSIIKYSSSSVVLLSLHCAAPMDMRRWGQKRFETRSPHDSSIK